MLKNLQTFYWFLLAFIFPIFAMASGEPFPIGAKSWGIGNATVALADRNAIFSNPAGLGFLEESYISSSVHSRFSISGLQNIAISGNYKTKALNIGLGIDRFGDKLYNEQKLGLAIGKSTNRVALGLKASYFQTAIENLASKSTILTEFGIITKLSSKFQVGFHAYNLTRAKLFASQRIPTILRLGFSFVPTKQINFVSELEKDLDYKPIIKAGLEYQIVPNFFLRTGVTSRINTFHFGLGFHAKKLILDYATSSHQYLGLSHHLSISLLPFTKKI